jgi:hypothetical protein
MVKAAFDLFIGDMSEKLGFTPLEGNERQRARWKSFSEAIIYKHKDLMPERLQNAKDSAPPRPAEAQPAVSAEDKIPRFP